MSYQKKSYGLQHTFCTIILCAYFVSIIFQRQESLAVEENFMPIIKKRPVFQRKEIKTPKISYKGETQLIVLAEKKPKKRKSLLGVFIDRLWKKNVIPNPLKTYFMEKKQKKQWPIKGHILEGFSKEKEGLFLLAPEGASVEPISRGRVIYAGSMLMDYGNLVIILHEDKYLSLYGNLVNILVKEGDSISPKNTIGYVGSKGMANLPQIYIGIRNKNEVVDPKKYLP